MCPIPYEVRLNVFEGPLDLLLHLIEREELDITTVSLAQVTDQYLDYIAHLEEKQAAHLVEFLVVASKLLLIKSRLLLPAPPVIPGEEEEEDVGEGLVRQLIEYRRFKQVAALLGEWDRRNTRAYVRLARATVSVAAKTLDMNGVSLDALVKAVRRALEIVPPEPPLSQVVPPITVSIQDKIALIRTRLSERQTMRFDDLLAEARSRIEIIVTFLAMLELIKMGGLEVKQERLFGDIFLCARPEGQKPVEKTVEPGIASEP